MKSVLFPWPFLGMLAVLSVSASRASAQEPCAQGAIASVFVDNHSIFDPDDLSDDQPFRLAYRLANALHMRSREGFIRGEVLFEPGDCYDPEVLAESERILRRYSFIARADVFGLRQPDGSWHVVVDTKDEWTTKIDLRVNAGGGPWFRGGEVAEENLLGRGIRAGVFLREREEQRDVGAELFTPRLFGTRMDAGLGVGRTRTGSFVDQSLAYPFVGEGGRVAGRQLYLRREELFPYSLGGRRAAPEQPSHLLLPVNEERFELTLAARIGPPGNLTTFGIGVSSATLDFPEGVEVALGGDFGVRAAAPEALADAVRPQTLHSSPARLNLLVGQRNMTFVPRRGLDALTGVQDVPVGVDAGLTLGRSARQLSADRGQPDDLFGRVRLVVGAAPGPWVLHGAFALEGRQIFSGRTSGSEWLDVLGEVDLLAYWTPPALSGHTFFARVEGAGGWLQNQPFQLLLGGAQGLRAYDDYDFPAAQRLLLTVEDRLYVRWPLPDLVDFGFTLFADAGRGWAGDVPFAVDSGWRGTVGGGLRLGFPAGSRSVARLDLAFPLGPGTDAGDAMVRFTVGDVMGLLSELENRQVRRSRRVTAGPDAFTPRR